eukprot:TRINITY_DN28040_c0_g1_i1.p1 TRINITY_DN28040_c0_g1~~TRINITY_DN28040_c0_g1_i1.p1  ORF type:complete len:1604 (-),score=292.11 TRINITY_DN28040_c0_g1_i1:1267-5553(-)
MAVVRRRLRISGDVMLAMKLLRPAIMSSLKAVAADLPAIKREVTAERPQLELVSDGQVSGSGSLSSLWMPNDASAFCLLCGLAWHPVIRRRHHCRACGVLVCGRCSTRRFSANGALRCLRCSEHGGSVRATQEHAESFLSSGREGSSMPTFGEPNASLEHELLPPTSESVGVLLAQLNAKLVGELSEAIPAKPPSELERRLWERVIAAETRSGSKTPSPVAVALRLFRHFIVLGMRFGFCAIVCFGATVSADDLPVRLRTLGDLAHEVFPRIAPRAFIALFGVAVAVAAVASRLFVVVACVAILVGRGLTIGLGFGGESSALLAHAVAAHPVWVFVCALGASTVLLSARSLRRIIAIYISAALPISIYWWCRAVQRTLGLSDDAAQAALYDRADALMAPFITNQFLALGGLFVKVGQWLANVASGVPLVYQSNLKLLQDNTRPSSKAHTQALICAEFGKPISELFEEFDLTPIASASIAQVHRAVIRDACGVKTKVAVKLQHEGIADIMLSDLAALRRIVTFCCWLGGETWADTKNMFVSWAKDMVLELDFSVEVRNLRDVRAGLEAAGINAIVPTALDGFTGRRAFVMEFCEGFRLTDRDLLAFHGIDRAALGRRVLHSVACQLLEIGVMNSDPHAGNLLCCVHQTTTTPVLLDFGNCIRLVDRQRLAYCRLLVALSEMSVTKAKEALGEIGLTTTHSDSNPERDLEYMLFLFRETGSRRQAMHGAQEFRQLRKQQRQDDYASLGAVTKVEKKMVSKQVKRYPRQVPDEFILFIRTMLLVRGICTQLDVELSFIQIFETHARRALVAACASAERARVLMPSLTALQMDNTSGSKARSRVARVYECLRRQLRAAIASCCAERPGLGVQVAVVVGGGGCGVTDGSVSASAGAVLVIDECGGVLGVADPRPMRRDTLVPLAELSRLPFLLAAMLEARFGRLSYNSKIATILGEPRLAPSDDAPTLSHMLAHRALAATGASSMTVGRTQAGATATEASLRVSAALAAARAKLVASSASELMDNVLMRDRILAALASRPLGDQNASYSPIGAGLAAATAVEAMVAGNAVGLETRGRTTVLASVFNSLSGGAANIDARELGPGLDIVLGDAGQRPNDTAPPLATTLATLSSSLFADLKSALSTQPGGVGASGHFLGAFTARSSLPRAPSPRDATDAQAHVGAGKNSASKHKEQRSVVASIGRSGSSSCNSGSVSSTSISNGGGSGGGGGGDDCNGNSDVVKGIKVDKSSSLAVGISSILDSAGGLLVDPALAGAVAQASCAATPASSHRCCPDLGGAASARALASLMAAAAPITSKLPALSCEPQHGGINDTTVSAGFATLLGFKQRTWDKRGLEVFGSENGDEMAAVGLTSGRGLLGIALQWNDGLPGVGTVNGPVTVVVLSNEMSSAATPARLLAVVRAGLNLPALASLPF